MLDQFKRRKLNPETKEPITETKLRTDGIPNPEWISKNKLDINSHPSKWFEAFLPNNVVDTWTSYTNTKAMMSNAGEEGKSYPDFIPFTCAELRKHIGLFMLQGISPSPQISMKFKNQNEDFANGSDFVRRSFGPNAARRHKHFKRFFGVQNPLKIIPPRNTAPLWKIQEFLAHINKISREAWLLGMDLSVDKQTIGFQGRHADKQRITYKKRRGRISV